ncbi:MAG: hypothetical protein E7621_03780 [Ruminococcaceae bacterium]|nr:hypothetical protein [Oscillospiraceae bacterium]
MKRNLSLWQFAGFAFTSLFGTILHFLYDWTNKSILIAPFSGVNESTWEHMKLLYFPIFVFALIQSRSFKDCKKFWCVKLSGIITGLSLIPMLFYTYNGAVGRSPDWLNIAIFFISAAIAFYIETRLFKNCSLECYSPRFSLLMLCVIGVLFIVFTFQTPKIPFFQDPLTGTYGLQF